MNLDLASHLRAGLALWAPTGVVHARLGDVKHRFRYSVDYVLLAPETWRAAHGLRSSRRSVFGFDARDHGGARGAGTGADWAWQQLQDAGLVRDDGMVMALLTQPRFMGFWFNPVSFWMVLRGNALLAVIAEVNNTYGQRHSYLCYKDDFTPITADDRLTARKVFHVSPFQDVAGGYEFRFILTQNRIAIMIRHQNGAQGLIATMQIKLCVVTRWRLVGAALRRPGGAARVVGLIYWQALRLWLKGVRYRRKAPLPSKEISR